MVLGEIFADAMEDGHIQKNPTDSRKLTIPSIKKTERMALEAEQVLDVIRQIQELDGTEKRLMALLLLTGMRRGEVLGLKWEDIDAGGGLIHIVRNVTYPYNQPTIGTPKSAKGIRTIPLDKQLWQMLQPSEQEGYIIGGEKPITRMVFTRMWYRIEKKVNLYGASPHVFRHSYLTIASNAGIDPKTIQALAGHADITTTMNIYVHQQTDHLLKAGDTMNAHLFPDQDEN